MPHTLGVFIGSTLSLPNLSEDLRASLGVPFIIEGNPKEGRMEWHGLGVDLILYEHDYDNDQALAFKDYRYYRSGSKDAAAGEPKTEAVSKTVSRVKRGGPVYNPASLVRSARRGGSLAVFDSLACGFRPSRTYHLFP